MRKSVATTKGEEVAGGKTNQRWKKLQGEEEKGQFYTNLISQLFQPKKYLSKWKKLRHKGADTYTHKETFFLLFRAIYEPRNDIIML